MEKRENLCFESSTASYDDAPIAGEYSYDCGIDVGDSKIYSANETVYLSRFRRKPLDLWRGMIFENESSVIFSDANVGKSILAVQIGIEIAKTGRRVLYMDYEMSDYQFSSRYIDESTKELYLFPSTFFRAGESSNVLDNGLTYARRCVSAVGATVLIIDNMTCLDSNIASGKAVCELMLELNSMKRSGLTVILLAHTPKRNLSQVLTQNHLGGSKAIMNFVDSVIGMSRCVRYPELRYIKNIKNRSAAIVYGEENVLLCRLCTTDSYCHFDFISTADEREMLRACNAERESVALEVKDRIEAGESYRSIAKALGVGVATVCRLAHS